jgi:hypothetical protein
MENPSGFNSEDDPEKNGDGQPEAGQGEKSETVKREIVPGIKREEAGAAFLGTEDLIKISWQNLKGRLVKFVMVSVLLMFIFLALFLFVVVAVVLVKNMLVIIPLGFLAVLVFIYVSLVQNVVTMEIIEDENISIREAIRASYPKIFPFFKATLACLAVFIGILTVAFVLSALLFLIVSLIFHSEGAIAIMGLFEAVVFFILVIPGAILLGIWQYFVLFSVIIDKKGVTESLAYSLGLIKNHKRELLIRLIVFLIFYILVTVLFMALAKSYAILMILQQLVNVVLSYLLILFYYALFKNVKKISSIEADEKDVRNIGRFINLGALVFVLGILFALAGIIISAR